MTTATDAALSKTPTRVSIRCSFSAVVPRWPRWLSSVTIRLLMTARDRAGA